MTLFNMIGSLLIGPLKLIFEVIFSVAYKVIAHPGPAIIVLSLAMNILVLPLYRRADAIQIEARDTENKLKDVVTHIKKTFSGDERMMILQTYYRQNNYSPLSILSGSISLLLEIPFFMAAYQFLSKLDVLQGVAFGPIADLSAPDGLITIGSVTINLLPIIMTLVNVISSSLYLKGFPLKTKIQLYAMAAFFLVFLYNSPAALVFYWTLNNTFSLIKTLFYRIKNSKQVLQILLCVLGIGSIFVGISLDGFWRSSFMIALGVVAQLPWVLAVLKKALPAATKQTSAPQPNTKQFILGALFLTVLVGLLIPSTYVGASPQEYIDTSYFYNPIWYVVHTLCLSAGTFMVWLGVFYWLANDKGKVIFSRLVWILSGVLLINYMFFGTKLGVVSPDLVYTDGFSFARSEQLINLAVIVVAAVGLYLLVKKFPKGITTVLLIGSIALTSMSTINIIKIAKAAEETKAQISGSAEEMPHFNLSKDGKNVVVIMLDRAIGPFVPYLMEENPALLEQFDGFTYYANTMSYGACTNLAAPALYGGYEYTPVNINLRSEEMLVTKHDEALKVMPALFAQEDYEVTILDPSYAGYQWISDLSIYDDIEGVSAYHADGKFNDLGSRIRTIEDRKRNFFFFSLMKTLPVSLQSPLYDDGAYRAIPSSSSATEMDTSLVPPKFMSAFNVLKNMDSISTITNSADNTFMFLRNNTTHEAILLQEPGFEPYSYTDNSAYYPPEGKTITAGEDSRFLPDYNAISHYHVNMAGLIQLGNWFDYLRENGVYDNTRIIVVSDHGWNLGVFDSGYETLQSLEHYAPLLLVKDFDAHGFTTSETFMTNADVPMLAVEGLIESPVNPYTGNPINSEDKMNNQEQYIIISSDFDVTVNNGTQFMASQWASVTENIMDKTYWQFYNDLTVLPPGLEN